MIAQPPKLDAPGKGLPLIEGLYARYIMFPRAMRDYDGVSSVESFRRESARMVELAREVSDAAFFTPVLIDRLPGLEDSSRYWSVAMTLEHLLLTMRPMAQIAETLAQGRAMNIHISTANVKPKGGRGVSKDDWLRLFTEAAAETELRLSAFAVRPDVVNPAKAAPRLHHPFFGQITAKGWIWVLGAHQVTHRRQVEAIIAGLTH